MKLADFKFTRLLFTSLIIMAVFSSSLCKAEASFYTGYLFDAISDDGTTTVGGYEWWRPDIGGQVVTVHTEADCYPNDLSLCGASFHAISGDGSIIAGDTNLDEIIYYNTITGSLTKFHTPGINYPLVFDVSADGKKIVGYYSGISTWGNAFIYDISSAQFTTLGTVYSSEGDQRVTAALGVSADGAIVVGHDSIKLSSWESEAFRWTAETGMVYLGNLGIAGSRANDVSSDGSTIVGRSKSPRTSEQEGFVWINANEGMKPLGDLPGGIYYSSAEAVNGDGKIVVGTSSIGASSVLGDSHAFIWTEVGGMRDLNKVLRDEHNIDLSGLTLTSATGISLDGSVIIGRATTLSGGIRAWYVSLDQLDSDVDGYYSQVDCNDNDSSVSPGTTEIKFDGIDQNCSGYDLTIQITEATYDTKRNSLTVTATSSLGEAAKLEVSGYKAMRYSKSKDLWSVTLRRIDLLPSMIQVSGIEGVENSIVEIR